MDVYAYCLVVVSCLGLMGFGGLLLPGSDHGRKFLAGTALVAGLGGILIWMAPLVIVSVFRVAVAVGWMVNLLEIRRWLRSGRPLPGRRALVCATLAVIAALAATASFHYRFVGIAESNYFLGPFVEIFQADYFGPLRNPIDYPMEMSAGHFIPSTALVAMGSLLSRPTMLQGLELRFLLAAFAVARLGYVALMRSGRSLLLAAPLLAAALLVFHSEITPTFRVSTFFYLVLVFELAVIVCWDRQAPERSARDALFLLTAMAVAKASIFYLPVLAGVWLVLRFPRLALHPTILLAGSVTFLQLLTTAMRPYPFPDVSIRLSSFNPTGGRAAFDYYPSLGDAIINDRTVGWLFAQPYSIGVLLVLALVAVKYGLVPLRAVAGLVARQAERREILRIAEVFLLIALAGLVLIRHDQHGTTHQIWLIYGSAPLVLGLILARCLAGDGGWRWPAGLAAAAVATILAGYNPWETAMSPSAPHFGGVTVTELERMSDAEALTPKAGEAVGNPCERALLKGLRIEAGAVPRACLGTLGIMTVEKGE